MDIILTNVGDILKSSILLAMASGIIGSIVVLKKDTLSVAVISNTQFVLAIIITVAIPSLNIHIAHLAVVAFALISIYLAYLTNKHSKLQTVILYPLISSLSFGVALAILKFVDRNILKERIEYSKYLIGSVLNVISFEDSTLLYTAGILILSIMLYRIFITTIVNQRYQSRRNLYDNLLNIAYFLLLAGVVFELNSIIGVLISPVMIVLPAITARLLTNRLKNMAVLSAFFSVISLTIGTTLSFVIPQIAPGILSVLALGIMFSISVLISIRLKKSKEGGN